MAVTVKKPINYKAMGDLYAFPVASGETIYQGTLASVSNDGLLYNLDSAECPKSRLVVLVADDSANSVAAATTSAGSISGALEANSAVAGDKTVRLCYIAADIELTFTAIAQTDVGKVVYATDNYTVDESMTSAKKIGTLLTYISATSGWVRLNTFYNDGAIMYKFPLVAVTGTTGGGFFSVANPTGETIMIEQLILDITTGSTGAATVDCGVANDGTTSSDTLIDGQATSVAKVWSNLVNGGTNGGVRKATSSQYVTGTASATLAGLVGTGAIVYRFWE